ncbi:tetratricopeptide repeat protein [Flammeovirga yaeyamensis]|uniref:Tetratricopeptide repeat protein n=1 Tax=Flammeovirga yaeyamensis TaxID=367791 RepID=A0AAX1NEP4_9BACT|nr:tetratricopeptide repeat protein [Flammeovirga yaeyamensis]MBB3696798.1 tetratricopeptide (TPR) repeat protein/phage shock protein PspC (stress-responsive transcriptional regulator) [Flammeovirga yaeyamensis]NMF33464.1 tetratricopeptide repeat protein [Flammeovirga yaeyamensis]QWG05261.1 tetratricopeptide repeat protein [Flammeovirga yaeyamensis]
MKSYYDIFRDLPDSNLLRRIENKDKYHKDAVMAAFDMLLKRGLSVKHPFPGEEVKDARKLFPYFSPEDKDPQHWFKYVVDKIPLKTVIGYLIFILCVLIVGYNTEMDGDWKNHLFIYTDYIVTSGFIYNLIIFITFFFFFFRTKKRRKSFLNINPRRVFFAFYISLSIFLLLNIIGFVFSKTPLVVTVLNSNSLKQFLALSVNNVFASFNQVLIVFWLLLSQLLIRFKSNKLNRRLIIIGVCFLSILLQLPSHLVEIGFSISTFFILLKFGFITYCLSVIYVRERNLLLLVFLMFILDLNYDYFRGGGTFYHNWTIFLIALFSTNSVSNNQIFHWVKSFNLPISGRVFFGGWIATIPLILILPNTAWDFYLKSGKWYLLNQNDKSLVLITEAIRKDDSNSEYFNLRGNIYYQHGLMDIAVKNYNRSIELVSDKFIVFQNRGNAYRDMGNYEEAIKDYAKCIENNYQVIKCLEERGNCYFKSGEFTKAIEDLATCLELSPNNLNALSIMGNIYWAKEDYTNAEFYLKKSIENGNNNQTVSEALALVYMKQDKVNEAYQVFYKINDKPFTFRKSNYNYGLALYHQGLFDEAIEQFQKSIDKHEEEDKCYYQLSLCYNQLKMPAKVCEYMLIAATMQHEQAKEDLKKYCE